MAQMMMNSDSDVSGWENCVSEWIKCGMWQKFGRRFRGSKQLRGWAYSKDESETAKERAGFARAEVKSRCQS